MEEPPKFKAGNLYPIDNDTMNNIEVICDGEESADNWSWMKLLNENKDTLGENNFVPVTLGSNRTIEDVTQGTFGLPKGTLFDDIDDIATNSNIPQVDTNFPIFIVFSTTVKGKPVPQLQAGKSPAGYIYVLDIDKATAATSVIQQGTNDGLGDMGGGADGLNLRTLPTTFDLASKLIEPKTNEGK